MHENCLYTQRMVHCVGQKPGLAEWFSYNRTNSIKIPEKLKWF